MAEDYYQKALEAAQAELEDKLRQKDKLDRRIAQLRQIVASLSAASEQPEDEQDDVVYIPGPMQLAARQAALGVAAMMGRNVGFTDAVREVLKSRKGFMTPLMVKDGLIRLGIEVDRKYANPLAVIHTTLKRLYDNGEVDKDEHKVHGTIYRWKTSDHKERFEEAIVAAKVARQQLEAGALAPRPKTEEEGEKPVTYTRKKKEEEGEKLPTMKRELQQELPKMKDKKEE